ncbi:hypothetical protein ACFFQW_19870 [Umezawaea endophytica]|uniref:Uncharacterized protein n=1 Tax=Umezawaea endophytica TaxID=1654476 RepID=A0A9X2VN43_9PSEU|nr:hypothetical protein [Umezawaea endophytica]MCS7479665.1 hypothetical protein [Umezawaea endophytica]
MAIPAFTDRSAADQYLVRRIAARDRVDPESLAALPARELDRLLPGIRATYPHRGSFADALLARGGIDPTSPEYQAVAAQASDLLARVDQLDSGHAA